MPDRDAVTCDQHGPVIESAVEWMRKHGGPEVFRITGARAGLTEDVRTRQRRYIISMSIRTVSVVLTVVLWNVERPLAWVTLVLGLLLPYVAVVYANAGRENGPGRPDTYLPPPERPALEPNREEPAKGRETEPPAGHPGTWQPGTWQPGTERPGTERPEADRPGAGQPS